MTAVQIQIVTFNSAVVIEECLKSVLKQTAPIKQILVIDNHSTDDTRIILSKFKDQIEIFENDKNLGYAGGHNLGFRIAVKEDVDYVVTLNPDTVLDPDYIKIAISTLNNLESYGGITGKLLRPELDGQARLTDSTGLQMESFYHVRDRGFGELDSHSIIAGSIWGICGAAAVYQTKMLRDIQLNEQFFDEYFFLYKEDVDLCWRANRVGWKFYYQPQAIAIHNRSWKKGSHPSMIAEAHSFANQIALLIAHVPRMTPYVLLTILIETIRWLLMLVCRPKTALKALRLVIRNWPFMWEKRRLLSQDIRKGAVTA